MRQASECPWCGAVVMTDTSRLDGGAEALAHVRKCEFIERPAVSSPSTSREVRGPANVVVGPDSPTA